MREDINKIPDCARFTFDKRKFRVTVVDELTGETIYDRSSEGGQICSVEKYSVLMDTGEIEGTQQHMMWGHPAVIIHANIQGVKKLHTYMNGDAIFARAVREFFKQ